MKNRLLRNLTTSRVPSTSAASEQRATGLLSKLENIFSNNPFLQRELRQLGRRPRVVQIALFLCLSVMALALLGWFASMDESQRFSLGLNRESWARVMLWILIAAHTLMCVIVAAYGGYRLFLIEQIRSTFELVQLLPYSPMRWLAQKLAFPALGVVIAWLTGLPFYFLAVLFGLIDFRSLPLIAHLPLLAGGETMLLYLFATPEYYRRTQAQAEKQKRATPGLRHKHNDPKIGVWGMLIALAGMAFVLGLTFGSGLSAIPRRFYGLTVPEAFYWIVLTIAIGLAAFLTGASALVVTESVQRRAHHARIVALVVSYFILGGPFVSYLPPSYQLIYVLLPVVIGLMMRFSASKNREASDVPSNLRSEREVQWIISRIPNALLMRDLRAYSRRISLLASFYWTLGCVLALPALYWLYVVYASALFPPVGTRILVQTALQMTAVYVPRVWGQPWGFWQKEQMQKTLPLLLLTPMTSREILWGRWLAATVYYGIAQSPLLLYLVAGIGWAFYKGYWMVAPIAVATLPLLMVVGLWMGCNAAGTRTNAGSTFQGVALAFAQTVLISATGLLAFWGLISGRMSTPAQLPWGFLANPFVFWILSIGLAGGHIALARVWFGFKAQQLDAFRSSDMEIPDSKELAPRRQDRRKKAIG